MYSCWMLCLLGLWQNSHGDGKVLWQHQGHWKWTRVWCWQSALVVEFYVLERRRSTWSTPKGTNSERDSLWVCHTDSYFFGMTLNFDPRPQNVKVHFSHHPTSMYEIWKMYVENYSCYCVRSTILTKFRCDHDLLIPKYIGIFFSTSCIYVWNMKDVMMKTTQVMVSVLTKFRCDLGLRLFDSKMYRNHPLTILHLCMKYESCTLKTTQVIVSERIRKLSGPDVSCWTWDQGHHREHHFCFLPRFTSVDWEGWSTSHFHLRQARWFQFPHHKLSVPE